MVQRSLPRRLALTPPPPAPIYCPQLPVWKLPQNPLCLVSRRIGPARTAHASSGQLPPSARVAEPCSNLEHCSFGARKQHAGLAGLLIKGMGDGRSALDAPVLRVVQLDRLAVQRGRDRVYQIQAPLGATTTHVWLPSPVDDVVAHARELRKFGCGVGSKRLVKLVP